MFYLSELEHKLQLPPHLLDISLHDGIKGELERLFLDKVIAKLGLCVSVYDIKSIDDGFIYPGEGAATYKVHFRLIMFRPFVGEVIAAKLKSADGNGLQLSLGFFEDIYVPAQLLPVPSRYGKDPSLMEKDPKNPQHFCWIWEGHGGEYPIDSDSEIRFHVNNIEYPPIPVVQDVDSQPDEEPKKRKPFAPMVITGSLAAEAGLGPLSWWV